MQEVLYGCRGESGGDDCLVADEGTFRPGGFAAWLSRIAGENPLECPQCGNTNQATIVRVWDTEPREPL